MKHTRLLGLSIGLSVGVATAMASTYDVLTGTGTVWAKGVSQAGSWYDANKIDPYDSDADDLMCYAACASNLIAWWQNSEYGKILSPAAPTEVDVIWQTYVTNNQIYTIGGDPVAAMNWWISGVYAPTSEAEWTRYYAEKLKEDLPLSFLPTSGYYFDEYGLTNKDLAEFLFDAWLYGEWSKDGAEEIDFRDLFKSGACFPCHLCG